MIRERNHSSEGFGVSSTPDLFPAIASTYLLARRAGRTIEEAQQEADEVAARIAGHRREVA